MEQLLLKVNEEKCIQLVCGCLEAPQVGVKLRVLLPSEAFLAGKQHPSSVSEWTDFLTYKNSQVNMWN